MMITGFISEWMRLPVLLKLGLLIFVAAGALDLAHHAGLIEALDPYLGDDGYYTHVALFVGMVVMMLGIFTTRPALRAPERR